jgi:hypothetical protein
MKKNSAATARRNSDAYRPYNASKPSFLSARNDLRAELPEFLRRNDEDDDSRRNDDDDDTPRNDDDDDTGGGDEDDDACRNDDDDDTRRNDEDDDACRNDDDDDTRRNDDDDRLRLPNRNANLAASASALFSQSARPRIFQIRRFIHDQPAMLSVPRKATSMRELACVFRPVLVREK